MSCGIYEIYNKVTSQIYIGSSINIKTRLNTHKSMLARGVHPNKYLQNSYNKYGKSNFEFNKLLNCSKDALEFYEDKFINLQFCNNKRFGYNLREVAISMRGYKHSEETKKKCLANKKNFKHSNHTKTLISVANKGKKPSELTVNKSIESRKLNGLPSKRLKVICVNLLTKEKLEFESRKAVADYFKCRHTTVSQAIKLNRVFCKNFKLENGHTI